MKIINAILKIVLSLILLMSSIGSFGFFPEPTANMYNTPEAFAFIEVLMDVKYINLMMGTVFILSLFFIWTKRIALASLLLLPITLNIMAFHAFLDGGLFKMGALMGNVLFLINIYFLYKNKRHYKYLLQREG